MNKILIILALAMVLVMPIVAATDTGTSVGINVNTQKFAPKVWMCDSRVVTDDNTENGANGLSLAERKHNYAFEGEQIHWSVLVMDKNKIEEVTEVAGTIGPTQAAQNTPNDGEVECKRVDGSKEIPDSCNARLDEEHLTKFDSKTMSYYDCTFTVETENSMHGEYFLTVEAKDSTGLSGTMAENEYWFLNPTIGLSVGDNLEFNEVMPGTDAYSNTMTVGNDAEAGSGVILDMFISGTDFYDPAADGAACPSTNQLALTNFRYYVTNGAFSSQGNPGADTEGYLPIPYSTDISGAQRIVRYNVGPCGGGPRATAIRGSSPSSSVTELDWNCGNALSPGSEMALTFKLSMPEPCVGDFSDGNIYFWGEAI